MDAITPAAPAGERDRIRRFAPALVLAFLSPAFGELLSGSSPPLAFFQPVIFLALISFYGGGAILVRELALRWGGTSKAKRWAIVLLLGAAYGIVEEGLTTKSFFDPSFSDAGALTHYGRSLGVNWLWTIDLTLFHTMVSIAAPIVIAELLFPARRDERWVGRRGVTAIAVVFAMLVALMYVALSLYRPPVPQYATAAGVAVGLGVLAWRAGRRRRAVSAGTVPTPGRILVVSFVTSFLVWLVLMFVAEAVGVSVIVTIGLTLVIDVAAIRWLVRAVGSAAWTDDHSLAVVSGVLLFWVLIALIDELSGLAGMSVVALATVVGLVRLRHRARAS